MLDGEPTRITAIATTKPGSSIRARRLVRLQRRVRLGDEVPASRRLSRTRPSWTQYARASQLAAIQASVGISRDRGRRRMPVGVIFADRLCARPPRKKRGPRRWSSWPGDPCVGSTRDINSRSSCSSRKRVSRARWSISARAALHHERSGLNMIASTQLPGLKPMSPGRWRGWRESCVSRFTLFKFFYAYLWLIVEMQCRSPDRMKRNDRPEGNRYARFDPPAASGVCR